MLSVLVSILGSSYLTAESLLLGPVLLAILTVLLQKVGDFKIWMKYPEEIQIYYLNMLSRDTLSRVLRTRRNATYVKNPELLPIEQEIDRFQLDEGLSLSKVICGPRGSGKSTSLQRLVDVLRDSYRRLLPGWRTKLPGPFHPKLVILSQPTRLATSPNQIPEFNEPVILIADDLHMLDHDRFKLISEKLLCHRLTNKNSVLLCAHEENLVHSNLDAIPTICYPKLGSEKHESYVRGLLGAISADFGIEVPEEVMDSVINRITENDLPPLYITAIMENIHHNEKRALTETLFERIPRKIKGIYRNDLVKRSTNDRLLIESVRLLQEVEYSPDIEILSMLYRALKNGEGFDSTMLNLSRTCWLDLDGKNVRVRDAPYEAVFDRFSQLGSIIQLTDLITQNGDQRAKHLLRYSRITDLLIALGNFFGSHIRDSERMRRCFEMLRDHYPESAIGHYNLGIAYWAQGEVEKAESMLVRATKLRPDFDSAWMTLSVFLETTGRHDEADKIFERMPMIMKDIKSRGDLGIYRNLAGIPPPSETQWTPFGIVGIGGIKKAKDVLVHTKSIVEHIRSSDEPWRWPIELGSHPELMKNEEIIEALDERHKDIIEAITSAKLSTRVVWDLIGIEALFDEEELMESVSDHIRSEPEFMEHLREAARNFNRDAISSPLLHSIVAKKVLSREYSEELMSLINNSPELSESIEIQDAIRTRLDGSGHLDI